MRKYGAIPSPADPRDWRVSRIAAVSNKFESDYETDWLPPVYNQKAIGSCVAFALKTVLEIQQYKETGQHDSLSAGFIYGNRADDHWQGSGMRISEALCQMKRYGVCLNSLFYLNSYYFVVKGMLTKRMYKNAKSRVISGYARAYTTHEIMSTIKTLGAAIVSIPVYRNFAEGKPVIERPKDLDILGWHAAVLYGWKGYNGRDKFHWITRNSYGKDWGDKGNCLLASDYYRNIEAWAVTDAPDVNQEHFLKLPLNIKYIYDTETGKKIPMSVPAQLVDGKAMIPVRDSAELLGREVSYDEQTQTIFIKKERY